VAQGETAENSIHDASMDRFRPILMTTLAAVMGAVPIAFGLGASGEERRPLGLVIVGGLIVSQFITLYVTPVIYLYMELFQEKVLDRFAFFRSVRTHLEINEQMDREMHAGEVHHRGDAVPVLPHGEENGQGNGDNHENGETGHR
jgi:predicted RND superfamily exporter protein